VAELEGTARLAGNGLELQKLLVSAILALAGAAVAASWNWHWVFPPVKRTRETQEAEGDASRGKLLRAARKMLKDAADDSNIRPHRKGHPLDRQRRDCPGPETEALILNRSGR